MTLPPDPPGKRDPALQPDAPPLSSKPPKSDARIGGMVATVALILMFVFTALFIWFAG